MDAFGSPTVQADLDNFDKQWGLPNVTVDVVKFGKIPAFDPNNSTMVGWAGETSLDVQYAHAIAPGAKIVLAETSVDESEGVSGFPQTMNAETYLIDHGVGDVISQSFGATENTFPGFTHGDYASLLRLRHAFQDAAAHRVTVLAGSGDLGAAGYELDAGTLYPYPVNTWPSSDPLVTSVGGTRLDLDDTGDRLSPDVVWSAVYGASGGGLSQVFTRPGYQNAVKNVVGARRGTPDISMSGAVDGGAWIYLGFPGGGGWNIAGGTSESTPIMAGIVALADQASARRLGLINPALYALGTGPTAARSGISQPYLYRLYPNKEALFAATVDHVSVVMTETLLAHEPTPGGSGPTSEAALDAARRAYAALVADRTILRFLMHANCAADEPLVGEAVRRCYAKQVETVRQLLGNDDDAVRRWFGSGMLDNVVAVLGLADIDEPWAHVLTTR